MDILQLSPARDILEREPTPQTVEAAETRRTVAEHGPCRVRTMAGPQ